MTYIAKPKFQHPGLPKNDLGFTHRDYEGKVSRLAPVSTDGMRPCTELKPCELPRK